MIETRRNPQLSFAEGLIAEEVSDLWDDWMRFADKVLEDEQLLTAVYDQAAAEESYSRTAGHSRRSRVTVAVA